MIKTTLLFSGGLDSILAARILEKQKIKIIPVCFKSYFFDCRLAEKSAKSLGLKLKTVDFSKEHLKIVKEPKYGRGKGMNPCLDCHLLMVKKAKELAKKYRCDFLSTGEVLGERPFSQSRRSLMRIEKEAGLEGLILRPLSAKLLPETLLEKKRQVKREELYAISGKSRKKQFELAQKFALKDFPAPSGGCLLTDLEYSKKLKILLQKNGKEAEGIDCQILRRGRILWQGKNLIAVGRNEKENKELSRLKKKRDIFLEPANFSGPTVLIRFFDEKTKERAIVRATEALFQYSKKTPAKIKIKLNGDSF